jgi:4-aminobutyrate aminotransferase/(S)-3-amino-2-methylpropionate transaminase
MTAAHRSEAAATLLPELKTEIPGPRSRALAERLARVESPNVTCLAPVPPIFWQRAAGANVWDVDGNRFIDLTAAFGVANTGHDHPAIVSAIEHQAASLLHGMGDVHPAAVKVELLERLAALYPGSVPARAVLGSSGSDAVESALKTAILATGKPGVIAFDGAYHGLSLGALDTTHRSDFRDPFVGRLPGVTRFARYGDIEDVERVGDTSTTPIGAVLIEPIQGRGGERVPPEGFLRALRSLCDERGWLLIADEIYTGFGRTGKLFACEHEDVVPDLLCVGKGLASGMPLSACMGTEQTMTAWPVSRGEALHTQTFLGHPLGCAAALASIAVIEREGLVERAAALGGRAMTRLHDALDGVPAVREVRGRGLMIGVELTSGDVAAGICQALLEQGVITLPSGEAGRVLSITPPLSIGEAAFDHALDRMIELAAGASDSGSAKETSA